MVRGIGGDRANYKPIVSQWTASSQPLEVAHALRTKLGLSEFYLADLGAIQGRQPDFETLKSLHDQGFALWIDAGFEKLTDAENLTGLGRLVLGLESLQGPESLRDFLKAYGPEIIFSLDMKSGSSLGRREYWPTSESWEVARIAIDLGITKMIVLDLANVGVGKGVATVDLCGRLRSAYPFLEITAGGGVRGWEDVDLLLSHGVNRVLVASALHDGRLPWNA